MIKALIIVCIAATVLLIALLIAKRRPAGLLLEKRRYLRLDYLLALLILLLAGYQIGQIFYRDGRLAVFTAVAFSYGLRYYHRWQKKRQKQQLKEEFIELNRMLLSELHAGKSLPLAYRALYQRLIDEGQHYQPNMQAELKQWCQKMDMGIALPDILNDFAMRCQDVHISQFVNMLEVAKSSGSSMLDVIAFSDRMISDMRQIERELSVLIAEKKLEQIVLSLSPIALLYMMQQFSYDFVAPLYETALGRLLMTVALVVFIAMFIWSRRMTELEL